MTKYMVDTIDGKPTAEFLAEASVTLKALMADHRAKSPRDSAEMAAAKRELAIAIRSRDAHRARIRSLLAMLPDDKRAEIVTELGMDMSSWDEQGQRGIPTYASTHSRSGHSVYFVQCVDGGPIKIGTSRDVEERVRTLQCASPVRLRIIGVAAGDHTREQELHRRLARHRLHGEWFADHADVLAAIAEVLQ